MNELLLFIEIIVIFSIILLAKRLFGKNGLFLWIGIASVLANLQVVKCIDVFGISATLGNVLFASNFLATDILSECYGKESAKKGVHIGLFSVIVYLIITQLTLLYIPNEFDTAQDAMSVLFNLSLRVSIASLTMFYIANLADVYLYNKLHKKFKGKKMWLRNNISTISCNCLENFGFTFLAFMGLYPLSELLVIAFSTCVIEIGIALCDTPFLYLAKKAR